MDGRAPDSPAVLERAGPLLAGYDVLFCDVWGVLHNGAKAYPAAGKALADYRGQGGIVVLVSNAPLPARTVADLLDARGVRRDCWDTIVSSGELTRAHILERGLRRIHHVGSDRDLVLFDGLDIARVSMTDAEAIVCTGVVDDVNETGESYRPLLEEALALKLPMICANPDLIVEVGDLLLPCAGAVAIIFEDLGGEVFWAGKPHRVAYEAAQHRAEDLAGRPVERSRILAIGDALRTDVAGAGAYGIDSLLIANGIHRDELMAGGKLDRARLDRFLSAAPFRPKAVMSGLT